MRYLLEYIKKDLDKKIVLLSGPRQVGKTWMSKRIFDAPETMYLNYDRSADRNVIRDEAWDREDFPNH